VQWAAGTLPDAAGVELGALRTVLAPTLRNTPIDVVSGGVVNEPGVVSIDFHCDLHTIDGKPVRGWIFDGSVRVDANDKRWALEMGGLDSWLRSRMPSCRDLVVLRERGTAVDIWAFFVPRAG
jgi:hypothetical protein